MPALWFSLSASISVTYSIFHFADTRKEFAIEFLLSLALFFEGVTHALKFAWMDIAYFPFIILVSAFYNWKTVIALSLLVPLFEIEILLTGSALIEKTAFLISLLLTAAISSLVFTRIRNEKDSAVSALQTIKDAAKDISQGTGMESFGSEAVPHYFASMLKTDEEIKELLLSAKHAVFADSVNFFTPHQNSFALRCSSEEKGDIIINGMGIISECIREKKVIYSGDVDEKKANIGYIKKGRVSTILAIPVTEGSALLGALSVDSSRYQAFSEPDRHTAQMFTGHLARILERERIYPKLKRDYNGLRILNEESSKLVSSLDINIIAEKLCEGAEKIAPSQVFFFLAKGRQFELVSHIGKITREKKKQFNLKGTFINMAVENKQPVYMAEMKDYRNPIMPFKAEEVRSVLAIPLLYENNLLGVFVMFSGERDFADTLQIELLKVMCNQASTSIANAQLHAEIEKLATTDGLTGLFNHRVFQEKLSDELKRMDRYSEQISLILTDIDFFKKVNDRYGHPAGDIVLKEVAKVIKGTLRDIDIPARYGGEEFAVILPQTNGIGAKNIAERLRKSVMDASFSADGASFKITLSIGIATSPVDAKTKEELIEKSDNALYHAKHNGRNQSVLWNEMRG